MKSEREKRIKERRKERTVQGTYAQWWMCMNSLLCSGNRRCQANTFFWIHWLHFFLNPLTSTLYSLGLWSSRRCCILSSLYIEPVASPIAAQQPDCKLQEERKRDGGWYLRKVNNLTNVDIYNNKQQHDNDVWNCRRDNKVKPTTGSDAAQLYE